MKKKKKKKGQKKKREKKKGQKKKEREKSKKKKKKKKKKPWTLDGERRGAFLRQGGAFLRHRPFQVQTCIDLSV